MTDDDDDVHVAGLNSELLAQLIAEVKRKERSENPAFLIGLLPATVITLVGLVQLATRHPLLPAAHRETAEHFINGARGYFADSPAVLAAFVLGDDPTADILPAASRVPVTH